MKDFKDTRVGKFLWRAGDTLKGKGKAGRVAEFIGEVLPIPNPVRIAKSLSKNEKVERLRQNEKAVDAADELGIDLSDLFDDSPSWVRSAFAFAVLAIITYLVITGEIGVGWLVSFASGVLGAVGIYTGGFLI